MKIGKKINGGHSNFKLVIQFEQGKTFVEIGRDPKRNSKDKRINVPERELSYLKKYLRKYFIDSNIAFTKACISDANSDQIQEVYHLEKRNWYTISQLKKIGFDKPEKKNNESSPLLSGYIRYNFTGINQRIADNKQKPKTHRWPEKEIIHSSGVDYNLALKSLLDAYSEREHIEIFNVYLLRDYNSKLGKRESIHVAKIAQGGSVHFVHDHFREKINLNLVHKIKV